MTSTIHADKIMNSSGDQDSGVDLQTNDQVKLKTANTDRVTITDTTTTVSNNLAANTIKHTGGTTAMTIDSAGRILKPAIPRFSARMTGSGMSSNSESWTTMVFDNTLVNNGSCYNTSTGEFTAPIAGDYWFSTHVLQGSSSPAYGVLKWLKNGSTNYTGNKCYSSTYDSWMSLSVILTLAANDTLVVQSYNRFSKADYGSFQGYLLG